MHYRHSIQARTTGNNDKIVLINRLTNRFAEPVPMSSLSTGRKYTVLAINKNGVSSDTDYVHVKSGGVTLQFLHTPAMLCANHTYQFLIRTELLHHSLGL